MDMLEHFEDNLNTNISNSVNVANFIKVGKTVVTNLNNKYHDGEFDDPANTDPRDDWIKRGWGLVQKLVNQRCIVI